MSVRAYPEYKCSDASWLGKVPSHWRLQPLRSQFEELKRKNESAADQNYLSLVAGRGVMPYAEKGDIGNKKPDDLDKCKLVRSGNFVINSMNFGIGAFGVSRYDGVCSPVYVVLEPSEPRSLTYLRWIFDDVGFRKTAQSFGNGILAHRAAIGWDELKIMEVGVPPLAEQAAIATFLGQETAKIDALVAEQERLITLLKEKRQAVISHAVSKGLNPDAPMKESGIEWLSEIPAHWEVTALKRACSLLRDGTHQPPVRVDIGIPLLSVRNIQDGSFSFRDDDSQISENDYNELCRSFVPMGGDILLAVVGATLGKSAIIPSDLGHFHIQRSVAIFRPNKSMEPLWLNYVFSSNGFQHLIWSNVGFSAQPGIYLGSLANFKIPIPPLVEQSRILEVIGPVVRSLEMLVKETELAITLLQERRAALISAAVTGKIDVRGLALGDNVVSIEQACKSQADQSVRGAVGALAIARLGKFGRMAVMKGGYLAEAYAGINELGGHYEREAAGPYCRAIINGMEKDAGTEFGIVTTEAVKEGDRVEYSVPGFTIPPSETLRDLVGQERANRFVRLLDNLKDLNRSSVEAVATLYAAWNDLLAEHGSAEDDAIFSELLTNWHAEKATKFTRSELETWLDWMRRHDVVPEGTAPRTDHQAKLL